MRRLLTSLLVLFLVAVAAFWIDARLKDRTRHLGFVPAAMEVDRVLFSAEEAVGWGPGGNEVGIIVYELPPATRDLIEAQGLAWLDDLEERPFQGRDATYRRYKNWRPTPYVSDPNLERGTAYHGRGTFDVWNTDGECLCVPLNREVEALVNQALSTPGSYYGFGRVGLMLVIPSESRIVFAYND